MRFGNEKLDVLEACGILDNNRNEIGKEMLDRIVAMLTKLGGRGYTIRENSAEYTYDKLDSESDSDAELK